MDLFKIILLGCLFGANGIVIRQKIEKFAKSSILGIALSFIAPNQQADILTFSSNPASITQQIHPANAAIAPLADVGIREFLVKDGKQFLRLSIPLAEKGKFVSSPSAQIWQTAQENLELIKLRFEQVGFTNPSAWGNALKDANTAALTIKNSREDLIKGARDPSVATQIFDEEFSPELSNLLDSLRIRNIDRTLQSQNAVAEAFSKLRLLQTPAKKLPFQIPSEYDGLPRLLGRAKIDVQLEHKAGFRLADGKTVVPRVNLELVVDGYHTPITAGNFVDLVSKGFYDNMPLQKVEQLTVQVGQVLDSKGEIVSEGYIDPITKQPRTIPLELFYKKDTEPVYSITSDDDLRATDTMALPFQAYGALGMARDNEQVDSASSQFFFLKWLQALIAPGRNTLDGFYSCFGYTTKNEDLLSQVVVGSDRIVYAKVIEGLENLVKN